MEKWYVMKASNNRASIAKIELEKRSVVSFVPLEKKKRKNRNGEECLVTAPILPSWIFVKSDLPTIKKISKEIDYLFLLYDRTIGEVDRGEPMVIPTCEMDEFITFVDGNSDKIAVVDHNEIDLRKGEKVKITTGAFKDKTATFISVKGKRNKQIVVKIEGYIAVMATTQFAVEKL